MDFDEKNLNNKDLDSEKQESEVLNAEVSNPEVLNAEETDANVEEVSAKEEVNVKNVSAAAVVSWQKELWDWFVAIALAVIVALVVKNFVFTLVNVKGASMEPSLHDGDRLFVNRFFYTPEKGDVVIFEPEVEKQAIEQSGENGLIIKKHKYYVKRVIATEGDRVYIDYKNGDVYVNDEKLDEPYIKEETRSLGAYIREKELSGSYSLEEPIVVPAGHIFAMGDNRNNSKDSRELGPIPEEEIMGGAVFRFWPFSSISGLHMDEKTVQD